MSTQESEDIRRAWDKVAPGYDAFVTPMYFRLGSDALRHAGLQQGMRVLDERLEQRARQEGYNVEAPSWTVTRSTSPVTASTS